MDTIEKQWDKFFGLLPKWLIGKPHHSKNVTVEKSKKMAVNADYLIINNINNSKVTATVSRSGGKLLVKFETDELTDQPFEYDLVYQAAGFQNYTEHLSGTVKATIDKIAILTSGQWRHTSLFEEWIDNGQPMTGEYIEECMQDNRYTFNLGGSGTYTTGAKKCDSSENTIENFSWSFNGNQTKLTTLGETWDLVSMDNVTFKIRRIYDDGGGLMVTQTLTFSK